jgi:hypothetical protein
MNIIRLLWVRLSSGISRRIRTSWTISEARFLVKHLDIIARQHGLTLALGGSVLFEGKSDHDLDIIVMPLKTKEPHSWENFYKVLQSCYIEKWQDRTPFHHRDSKRVFTSKTRGGRRIDWFLFHLDPKL